MLEKPEDVVEIAVEEVRQQEAIVQRLSPAHVFAAVRDDSGYETYPTGAEPEQQTSPVALAEDDSTRPVDKRDSDN